MTKAQLNRYCEAEFENIEKVIAELDSLIRGYDEDYSITELAAMATFIHNFYNGVENILKRISQFLQIRPATASRWHRELLTIAKEKGIVSEPLVII